MLRRIRSILCGLSLLLFVTLLIAWPFARRNPVGLWYKHTDTIYNSSLSIKTPHFYFVTIDGKQLSIGHWRHPKIFDLELTLLLLKYRAISETPAQITEEPFLKRDGVHTGPNPLYPWPPSVAARFAGLTYEHQHDASKAILVHRITLPMWLPLTLLAIAPAIRGYRLMLRFDRLRTGHCPSCGYDLRATPNLCPECGHATDAALSR